jgi:hypothetical protein
MNKFEVIIQNRSAFLLKIIPQYHPESVNYLTFWKEQKKRCIEGFWAQDTKDKTSTGDWRYMPAQLYFYSNFGTILHKPDGSPKTTPRVKIKPNLDDIDWEFFYAWLYARGFSGFEDSEYTCCREVDKFERGEDVVDIPESAYNKDGSLKKYKHAYKLLLGRHSKNLGRPIYDNTAKNLMLLGTRGGGKSYWASQGVILHEVLFDGAKYYNPELQEFPLAEICAGSAIGSKSSEMLQKTEMGMHNLAGVWKKGTVDEIPAPFYRKMSGSLAPNNAKNPWKFEYEKKISGEWKKVGTGSNVKHVIYTIENPEAAAGGRYSVIVVEEVGLTPNLLTIHGSNDATMYIEHKFGSALYIGTGGNIEKIVESEVIFRDPAGYDMLEFDDTWENTGKIGLFIPAHRGDRKFKDSEGNTKVVEAQKYYEKRREIKRKAKSSTAIELEQMNYPEKPSEIFLNKVVNKFAVRDAKARLAELMGASTLLDASYRGHFDIVDDIVKFNNTNAIPIREYPITNKNADLEGCVEIWASPIRDESGNVPYGRYIASLDPIDDDDNKDVTRSLQSFWVLDLWTDNLVLEYTGRTRLAKEFYEQCRRALLFYNALLLYENQKKGVFQYLETVNSVHLLADTPAYLKDMDMQKISNVGNRAKGTYATDALNAYALDLLVGWTDSLIHPDSSMSRMMGIKSPALLKEIIFFSRGKNTDRISSLLIMMLYRESKIKYVESAKKPVKTINNDPLWDKIYNRKAMLGSRKNSIFSNIK